MCASTSCPFPYIDPGPSAGAFEPLQVQVNRAAEAGYGPGLAVSLVAARNAMAGAEVTALTPGLADHFGTASGLLVLRVAPDTPAAKAGLMEGDVVVEAGGTVVSFVVDLRDALLRKGNGPLEIVVVRHRQRQALTIGG